MKTNELKACPLEEQPTTNCSQLEQTFTAKIIPPEDFPDREWTVRKGQDIVAFFKENGLHEIINTSFTPLELRQLADLVEETLEKGGKP